MTFEPIATGTQHTDLVDRLGAALAALRTADVGNIPWPSDIPQLDPELKRLRDKQDHATTYDLACFAGAFLLLHETCHAQKRVRGEAEGGITKEMECDRFAIEFLITGCDVYAARHHHTPLEVLRKRAMGLFIGLAVVLNPPKKACGSHRRAIPPPMTASNSLRI